CRANADNKYILLLQNVERFFFCYIVKLFVFSLTTLSPHLTVWKFSTWRDWTPSLPATTGSPVTQINTMHGRMTSNRSKKSEESAFLHR
ncbi:MAG: hypothetical protein ACK56I_30400, partial [bacterium]